MPKVAGPTQSKDIWIGVCLVHKARSLLGWRWCVRCRLPVGAKVSPVTCQWVVFELPSMVVVATKLECVPVSEHGYLLIVRRISSPVLLVLKVWVSITDKIREIHLKPSGE